MKRNQILILAIGAGMLIIAIVLVATAIWIAAQRPKSPPVEAQLLQGPLPTNDWYVCAILGEGTVPGVGNTRLRFRLCHDDGWEILAYCLQPRWPAPELGARCQRIDENTFWCGEGLQNLREYAVLETPVPTLMIPTIPPPMPSPTATLLPTATPSPTASVTPGVPSAALTSTALAAAGTQAAAAPSARQQPAAIVQRPSPGGRGLLSWLGLASLFPTRTPFLPPTRTPFLPQTQTPSPPEPQENPLPTDTADRQPSLNFYGIDFSDASQRIRIKIYPANRLLNSGSPIVIAFTPGAGCEYGDRRACINAYTSGSGSETTYITVHSGLGGEGQKFRHAVEGTGLDTAWFSLSQVQERLRLLEGAEVTITQGDLTIRGLRLTAAGRVAPQHLQAYMSSALPEALSLAASLNPSLAIAVQPTQPQIVFETCGWKMPGEPWAPGTTSTTASIYLGVIQISP